MTGSWTDSGIKKMSIELHPWALDGIEEVPAQQKVEHEEGEEGERPPDVVHPVSSSRGERLNTLMVETTALYSSK